MDDTVDVIDLRSECQALAFVMIRLDAQAMQLDSEFHYHQAETIRYARDQVRHTRSLLLRQLWLSMR